MSDGIETRMRAAWREIFVADDSGRVEQLRSAVFADLGRLPAVAEQSRPIVPKPWRRSSRAS